MDVMHLIIIGVVERVGITGHALHEIPTRMRMSATTDGVVDFIEAAASAAADAVVEMSFVSAIGVDEPLSAGSVSGCGIIVHTQIFRRREDDRRTR